MYNLIESCFCGTRVDGVATLQIITVGSEPTVRHWTVNGLPVAAVPGGHNHAFSVAFNDSSVHYEVCMCVMCVLCVCYVCGVCVLCVCCPNRYLQ